MLSPAPSPAKAWLIPLTRNRRPRPVYLDMRHVRNIDVPARFPGISAFLAQYGLDLRRDLIPVRPAAHYLMGGIRTDLVGRTASKAFTQRAKPHAPASMAPIGWRPTRCLRASSSARAPPAPCSPIRSRSFPSSRPVLLRQRSPPGIRAAFRN